MAYALGNARVALDAAREALRIHINHAEDNPLIVMDFAAREPLRDRAQVRGYEVPDGGGGAVLPSANFEPLPIVAELERLALALASVSARMTQAVLRFENPALTGLPRFLAAPGNEGHAFGAIQKTIAALDVENRWLATPLSVQPVVLAGSIEDTATFGPLVVENLGQIVRNLYEMASFQLLHATQAIDLRPGFEMGEKTRALYSAYRRHVPFVDRDRVFTRDIACGVQVLRGSALAPCAE